MTAKYRIVEFNRFDTGVKSPAVHTEHDAIVADNSNYVPFSIQNGQTLAGTGALVWEGELLERAC